MKVAAVSIVSALALVLWSSQSVSGSANGRDLSAVNGSVSAEPGQTYDSVHTVNGAVRVGRGAIVEAAKTVNGALTIEEEARVGTASTVNGSVVVGKRATVSRDVSTVNGAMVVEKQARVDGDVSTVSGAIRVDGGEVSGKLITRNGAIDLSDGARVRGGIHVHEKGKGWGSDRRIEVNVCATCIVDGELRFDRPVELHVENGGRIGQVVGADVTRR